MKHKNLYWLAGLVLSFLFFVFLFICVTNASGAPLSIDNTIHDFFVNHRGNKNGFINIFALIFTQAGSAIFFVIATIAILVLYKGNYKALAYLLGACLVVVLNKGIKSGICRFRPDQDYFWVNECGYSFPSGHSMLSAYSFSWGIYMLHDFKLNSKLRISLNVVFALIMIIVPITRLILAVHYFTDVLAGSMLSICIAFLSFELKDILLEFNILPISIKDSWKNRKSKKNKISE
ncbi:MAG: phosphatase PAP2 family protein [Acholeplasmatales bacterium]|nr:phosphatase PAP2 family protein [Acholeplasmatales bacterium]